MKTHENRALFSRALLKATAAGRSRGRPLRNSRPAPAGPVRARVRAVFCSP